MQVLPFAMLELPKIMNDPKVNLNPAIFLSNAAAAFGEHLSGLLLPHLHVQGKLAGNCWPAAVASAGSNLGDINPEGKTASQCCTL